MLAKALLGFSLFALASDNAALIRYKNSPHHLFVGYLVGDGNDPVPAIDPANAPDSADFLEFFAGQDPNRADWRVAQAKGTRIVSCHFPKYAFFDGSDHDTTIKPVGKNSNPTPNSTYFHWAKAVFGQIVKTDSLDGIDIDIESGTFGGQVQPMNAVNFLTAVAQYFGPNSTGGVTVSGKKPIFFFDTDGSFGDGPIYTPYKGNFDYVLFQAYTNGNHYWSGSRPQDFPPLIALYGADKLIYLVNGDDFDGKNNNDPPSVALLSYATWVKQNNAVGVGAYRMSRDYDHTPHFISSRTAIQIMNPAAH